MPAIVAAQRLFGEPGYLLRVVAADLDAYRCIYDELARPQPRRFTTDVER